jgi:hypothetical protein
MEEFVIAFDTNMLLDKAEDCVRYIEELEAPSPRFKLALDKRGLIKKEYEREHDKLIAAREGLWGDSILAQLLDMIDRNGAHVVNLEARLPKREKRSLKRLSCRDQIELTLFSIAKNYAGSACVLLTGSLTGRVKRGYPTCYETIRQRYLRNNITVKDSLDRILHDPPCPSDYQSLKRILDNAQWKEDERHEFKLVYTNKIAPRIAREVCGMLNNQGGYIFIGITDPRPDAQLTGFDWKHDGGGVSSSSERKDAMVGFISTCIDPLPTKIVVREVDVPASNLIAHETTKDLPPNRLMVIAIYVPKGTESYCYYDKDKARWVNCKRIDSISKAQYQDCPHSPGFHPKM